MRRLTKAEKAEARLAFAAGKACEHCGALHQRACNRVRRVEKLGNGNVTAVEFWRRWEQPDAIWPDDAFDPDDDGEAAGG
ncbi:MAG TPA: hypothetical protein VKV80_20070 [Streptosporangiaceae bacterium]|jgi:hypothetical protein|nr:hypothetical protein [Streptosporangiaceae bacterium]